MNKFEVYRNKFNKACNKAKSKGIAINNPEDVVKYGLMTQEDFKQLSSMCNWESVEEKFTRLFWDNYNKCNMCSILNITAEEYEALYAKLIHRQ